MEYNIYTSSGNDTALVNGIKYSNDEKKQINDFIMMTHRNVEQVGFIDRESKTLIMAGNEFCGNAIRCFTYEILNGSIGEIRVNVNNNIYVSSGIDENKDVWCEIPLKNNKIVSKVDNKIYKVEFDDIIFLVLLQDISKKYLLEKSNIIDISKTFIKDYKLTEEKAVGIIYLEDIGNSIKINPIVWVKEIDTCFYETACGSGSMAVCLTLAKLNRKNIEVDLVQPSNKVIKASVEYDGMNFSKSIISGEVIKLNSYNQQFI